MPLQGGVPEPASARAGSSQLKLALGPAAAFTWSNSGGEREASFRCDDDAATSQSDALSLLNASALRCICLARPSGAAPRPVPLTHGPSLTTAPPRRRKPRSPDDSFVAGNGSFSCASPRALSRANSSSSFVVAREPPPGATPREADDLARMSALVDEEEAETAREQEEEMIDTDRLLGV